MCTVVNKYKSEYDIYIGRGSKWGNPFSHMPETKASHKVETREEAVAAYKEYLWHQMKEGFVTPDDLRALHGKRLGCFCAPQACHGDVIAAAVNWVVSRS
jgi:hypothetical protein